MRVYRELPILNQSVLTIGSFDGLHRGHQYLIEQVKKIAKQKNGKSTIVTFEPHPRIVLQPESNFKLLNTTEEKLLLFESLGIDNLILFPFTKEISELSAELFVQNFILDKLNPSAIVLGYDHKFGKDRKGSKETFIALQNKLLKPYDIVQIDEFNSVDADRESFKVSSTEIRNHLYKKELKKANNLLGYEYHLIGKVIEGKKIGASLGYPTANIEVDNPYKLIPPKGIYSGSIHLDGNKHVCAISVSTNPTISSDNAMTIEAHILDFNETIYGKKITLCFKEYIRGEIKFDSLEDLKLGIENDVKHIRSLYQ